MKIELNLLHKTVLTRVSLALGLAGAVLLQQEVTANSNGLNFGTAAGLWLASGSETTANSSSTGDGDSHPSLATTGMTDVALTAANHGGDAIAVQARSVRVVTSSGGAGRAFEVTEGDGLDLASLALFSGAHDAGSSFFPAGKPTVAGAGSPGGSMSGGAAGGQGGGQGDLGGGAQAGGSATLGTKMDTIGSVLALETTLNTDVVVAGGALTLGGAVALDNNAITAAIEAEIDATPVRIPDSGSTLAILGVGLTALAAFSRRFTFRAALLAG